MTTADIDALIERLLRAAMLGEFGHVPVVDLLHEAADALAALQADAARLDWFFGDTNKSPDSINEYLRGVREHWTVNQWRAWIDEAMK